jgi:hypothetical protein
LGQRDGQGGRHLRGQRFRWDPRLHRFCWWPIELETFWQWRRTPAHLTPQGVLSIHARTASQIARWGTWRLLVTAQACLVIRVILAPTTARGAGAFATARGTPWVVTLVARWRWLARDAHVAALLPDLWRLFAVVPVRDDVVSLRKVPGDLNQVNDVPGNGVKAFNSWNRWRELCLTRATSFNCAIVLGGIRAAAGADACGDWHPSPL